MASGMAKSRTSNCALVNLLVFPDAPLSLLTSFLCHDPEGQTKLVFLELCAQKGVGRQNLEDNEST